MQLSGFNVNVAGQDVVQHNAFNEVVAVVLFIVVLLDAGKGNGEDGSVAGSHLVGAFHENGVIRLDVGPEGFVGVAVPDENVVGVAKIRRIVVTAGPDLRQIAAGDDGRRFIDHADHTVDGVPHLMDNALEKTIGHNIYPFIQV